MHERNQVSPDHNAPGERPSERRCSLLVVSDRPEVRREVAELAGQHADVRQADGVRAAFDAFDGADVDVLLADQSLSPLTGLGLLDWARHRSPGTVGLLLIGYADLVQIRGALSRGLVHDCLLHPLEKEIVLSVLDVAVRQAMRARVPDAAPGAVWRSHLDLVPALLQIGRTAEEAMNELLKERAEAEKNHRRLRRLLLEMECLAMTDSLTSLPNRRAIEAVAEHEVRRRSRYPGPLALGMIDADHFREINTVHKHPGGDEALVGIGRSLAGALRVSDQLGRVGGEEFLVVAPQTDQAGAEFLAERLRTAVEQAAVRYRGQDIPVTVSVGFAVAEASTKADLAQLYHFAADALARAKQAGRNRSVVLALPAS
jgi:diguanylate cyclase (GGDEF)-like protein